MSVSGRGREYNSIYSNTAYRIIGQLGLYGTAAKPKCQSVDELDSFHGSIIRSIDEEGDKRWMEEKNDERERERDVDTAVGGSSLRSKALRVISPWEGRRRART